MNISLLLYELSRFEIELLPGRDQVRVTNPQGQADHLRPYLMQYKPELVAILRYCRPFPAQLPFSIGEAYIDHDLKGWWIKTPYNREFIEDLKDQLNRQTGKRNCSWSKDREAWWINSPYIGPALDLVAKYFAPDRYDCTQAQMGPNASTRVQTEERGQ